MPYTITLEHLPLGHAASAAKADDAFVSVQTLAFTSTEDGQQFIKSLEGFPQVLLGLLVDQCGVTVHPSQVDHFLAIIRRDRTATVFLNELPQLLTIQALRPIGAGELVGKNDIADITRLKLGDVAIPADSGIVLLFSVGWRKGLFYDFGPLNPMAEVRREFDCPTLFAQLYAHVLFQERFSILESEWQLFFKSKLFPFAGLRNETIDTMLSCLRAGWDLSSLTDAVVTEVRQKLPNFMEAWCKHPVFSPHIKILELAAKHFEGEDYVSCVGLVFPRIEGILRTNHVDIGCKEPLGQSNLAQSAVAKKEPSEKCLLLPRRFGEYLERVYFAGFDRRAIPCAQDIPLSRNSVAHGVASPESFTAIEAAIGFLVLYQLFHCFERVA